VRSWQSCGQTSSRKAQSNITPYFVEKARGATVYDVEGRELIDFAGGIGVMKRRPQSPGKWLQRLKIRPRSLPTPAFTLSCTSPTSSWLKKLCGLTPGSFPKMGLVCQTVAPKAVENAGKKSPGITPSGKASSALTNGFMAAPTLAMTLTSKVKP